MLIKRLFNIIKYTIESQNAHKDIEIKSWYFTIAVIKLTKVIAISDSVWFILYCVINGHLQKNRVTLYESQKYSYFH